MKLKNQTFNHPCHHVTVRAGSRASETKPVYWKKFKAL
jgi:hypothetical protein